MKTQKRKYPFYNNEHKPYSITTSPCYGFNIKECLTKTAYLSLGSKDYSPLYGLATGLQKKKVFKIIIEEII